MDGYGNRSLVATSHNERLRCVVEIWRVRSRTAGHYTQSAFLQTSTGYFFSSGRKTRKSQPTATGSRKQGGTDWRQGKEGERADQFQLPTH